MLLKGRVPAFDLKEQYKMERQTCNLFFIRRKILIIRTSVKQKCYFSQMKC